MEKKDCVFVYGTLRKHEHNHSLLAEARCLAAFAWTPGLLYDTGLGYPAMTRSDGGRVYGELYNVDTEALQAIDLLEGYVGNPDKNLYDRVRQDVFTENTIYEAYVYVINRHYTEMLRTPIESGNWLIYSRGK